MVYKQLLLIFLSAFASTQANNEFATAVRQNFQDVSNTQVQDLIRRFSDVQHVFKAYASYFRRADVALPCTGRWFARLSNEIWREKEILVNLVSTRGGMPAYYSMDVNRGCRDIVAQTEAKIGDGPSDDVTRMCICEELTDTSVRTSSNCGAINSSTRRPAKFAMEDAVAALRYLRHHSLELAKLAISQRDGQLEGTLKHDIIGKGRSLLKHTADHVTRLQRLDSMSASMYFIGELDMDDKLCTEDLNYGVNLSRRRRRGGSSKWDSAFAKQVVTSVGGAIGVDFSSYDGSEEQTHKLFSNGQYLGMLANWVKPGHIPENKLSKPQTRPFNQMELIEEFLRAASSKITNKSDMFNVVDLYQKVNLRMFINTLHALGFAVRKDSRAGYSFKSETVLDPKEFSKEQIRAGKEIAFGFSSGSSKIAYGHHLGQIDQCVVVCH